MRKALRKPLALVFAIALVVTAVGGAAEMGMVDRDRVEPVGNAQALACGGLCIAGVAGAAGVAAGAIGAAHFMGDSSVNETALAEADAHETKVSLYQSATTQAQNNEIINDSYQNYLQDTPTIARMEGKNAYIRALENGSSEAAARAAARQAVADYYATKQKQLATSWQTSLTLARTLRSQAEADANVSDQFITQRIRDQSNDQWFTTETDPFLNATDTTLTLVNSSTVTVGQWYWTKRHDNYMNPTTDPSILSTSSQYSDIQYNVRGLYVKAPDSNYQSEVFLRQSMYYNRWTEIESQNQQVQSEVSDFVNSTYAEYQQGDINSSDLVDPYLSSREYSPDGEYGTWALTSMTSLGYEPPQNLSDYGHMEIRDEATGATYEGILLSDGTPQDSGSFEIGTTYDTAAITGAQYVASDGETHDLVGNFTITNATSPDGEPLNRTTIEYRDVDYQTTSISEYQERMKAMQDTLAEIESRQQRLRQGGGGGLFDGIGDPWGLNNAEAGAVLAILAFLVLALLAVLS